MVASIQLTFPFLVKSCLNIAKEWRKLNVFRHVDTTFRRAILFQWLLLPVRDWYEQCGCVGAWAKYDVYRQ